MMKKVILLVTGLLASFLLVACGEQPSDWLEGTWHSEEWAATYEIEEEEGKWTVSIADTPVQLLTEAELEQDGDVIRLKGVEEFTFEIERKDEKTITIKQIAEDGLSGTTDAIEFVEVD